MTLLINNCEVEQLVSMSEAIETMEHAFAEQGRDAVVQPPRLNTSASNGWLRLGPAILEESGWMGFKAMNLVRGVGVRYVVFLYRLTSG